MRLSPRPGRAWPACLLLLLCAHVLPAATFSFTGTFDQDDDVRFFQFNLDAPSAVTLLTYSYGGGTNGAGEVIPAGGFEPVISLFSNSGTFLVGSGPDGSCPPQNVDAGTGLCVDAYVATGLAAGSYFVALTQFFNIPNGPRLSNGFLQQGTGNFTGPEICGTSGSFLDEACNQRTSAFALDIEGVTAAQALDVAPTPIPEPASVWLLLPPLAVGVFLRRRKAVVPAR